MKEPTNKQTQRRDDDATSRLHAHNPKAHALFKEGRRIDREKRRKEWYAKNGGGK